MFRSRYLHRRGPFATSTFAAAATSTTQATLILPCLSSFTCEPSPSEEIRAASLYRPVHVVKRFKLDTAAPKYPPVETPRRRFASLVGDELPARHGEDIVELLQSLLLRLRNELSMGSALGPRIICGGGLLTKKIITNATTELYTYDGATPPKVEVTRIRKPAADESRTNVRSSIDEAN